MLPAFAISPFLCVTPRQSHVCRRRRQWRACGATSSGDDFEDVKKGLESIFDRSPSTWPAQQGKSDLPLPLRDESNADIVDKVKDKGMEEISAAAQRSIDELDALDSRMKEFADEEAEKVLKAYEDQRMALVEKQEARLQEIHKDEKEIKELVSSLENPDARKSTLDAKQLLPLAMTVLLAVAAVGYFWSGITEENGDYLRYAAIDAVLAAAFAFYSDARQSD